jgi:hypothetical protein
MDPYYIGRKLLLIPIVQSLKYYQSVPSPNAPTAVLIVL